MENYFIAVPEFHEFIKFCGNDFIMDNFTAFSGETFFLFE